MLIPKLENNLSEDLIKSLSNSFEKTQRQNERKYFISFLFYFKSFSSF